MFTKTLFLCQTWTLFWANFIPLESVGCILCHCIKIYQI